MSFQYRAYYKDLLVFYSSKTQNNKHFYCIKVGKNWRWRVWNRSNNFLVANWAYTRERQIKVVTSTQPRNFILKTCLDSIFSEDSYSRRLNTSSTGSANGGATSGNGTSSGGTAASNNGLGTGGDFPGKMLPMPAAGSQ